MHTTGRSSGNSFPACAPERITNFNIGFTAFLFQNRSDTID